MYVNHWNHDKALTEAYRRHNREQRLRADLERSLARIARDVGQLERAIDNALFEQYAADKAFHRAVRRFTGHSQFGWEVACGTDGRLIKLGRTIGWEKLSRLIIAVRRYYGE